MWAQSIFLQTGAKKIPPNRLGISVLEAVFIPIYLSVYQINIYGFKFLCWDNKELKCILWWYIDIHKSYGGVTHLVDFFPHHFQEGGDFCDFLFAHWHIKLCERVQLLKERTRLNDLFFRSRFLVLRDTKTLLRRIASYLSVSIPP